MVRRIVLGVLALLVLALGAGLALTWAPDIAREELVAKYGQKPSQFLTLPSGDVVHWRDQGVPAGPAIVLLHGSNDSLHTWEAWVPLLGARYRVITLDLPGHGLTGPVASGDYSQKAMAAFVRSFADAVGLERFILGGNSMGGSVALRLAGEAPERVRGLVLVSSGGVAPPGNPAPPLGFQLLRTPLVREVFRVVAPRALFESTFKAAVVDDALATPETVDRFWELARLPGQRAATLARFSTPLEPWISQNFARITCPVLLLWGREDRVTPIAIGEILRQGLPGAVLIPYDNVGHLAQLEVPALSAGDALQFMDALAP